MRLIPIQLLDVTPRQQLLGQVREFSAMAKDIYLKGKVNHILINKINNYSIDNLFTYSKYLENEMNKRGYKLLNKTKENWNKYLESNKRTIIIKPYVNWFTNRYIKQVIYNWQEKYDCGGISIEEWNKILEKYKDLI